MASALRLTPEQLAEIEARLKRLAINGKVASVRQHTVKDDDEIAATPHNSGKKQPRRVEIPTLGGKVRLSEAEVLKACLQILDKHPAVARSWRQNVGMAVSEGRVARFGFRGCSDILGFLAVSGRILAVECKATGKSASPDQAAFLAAVNAAGGLGLCVDDPAQLVRALPRVRR